MCDYSLQGLPNRLAMVGEQLVTHRFPTHSIGMASPHEIAAASRSRPQDGERWWWSALKYWFNPEMEFDKVPAVCIPPGARLRIRHVPEQMQRKCSLRQEEEVTFVQLTADTYRHRDAIRFDNGCREVLQTFGVGVAFDVLRLDVDEPKSENPILASRLDDAA
jgi:hypothetical protein